MRKRKEIGLAEEKKGKRRVVCTTIISDDRKRRKESCESQRVLAIFEIESGTYTFQYGIVFLFFCDSDIFVC